MIRIIDAVNSFVWMIPVLPMLLFSGIVLTIKSRYAQLRLFKDAVRGFITSLKNNKASGASSGYSALCTALAATVGTGNIAGVAGAIAIGGPGVIFWMWVCGVLGMVTKMAEVTLALHFRKREQKDSYIGGPMYIIEKGLSRRLGFLSYLYCIFGIFAAFGVGNAAQMNAVIDGIKSIGELSFSTLGIGHLLLIGAILSCMISLALRKGTSGIGGWTTKLVPFAAVSYMVLAIAVLLMQYQEIPGAFLAILTSAFSPSAITGGVVGSAILTFRVGISRGIFTNEAGMGTASIAHASSNVANPLEQGFLGMMEVFLDTILLCTLTALVILCSGVPITYGEDPGILLTLDAFAVVLGDWSKIAITCLVCIFAFATVLGWGFYGIRFSEYLFGNKAWHIFVAAESVVAFISVFVDTSVIWVLSEIFNGLMAIPNLVVMIWLMPIFLGYIRRYIPKD